MRPRQHRGGVDGVEEDNPPALFLWQQHHAWEALRSPCAFSQCRELPEAAPRGVGRAHGAPSGEVGAAVLLMQLVEEHGPSKWNRISAEFNALQLGAPRDPKACRLRWSNQLDTRLNHGPFTEEENQKIIEMHAIHGNKWAQIAAALPGRTDNAVKNQWNCKLAKRVNEQSGSPDSTPRGARASGHGVTQDFSGIPPQVTSSEKNGGISRRRFLSPMPPCGPSAVRSICTSRQPEGFPA